jgi:maltose/moltooligosaccharide transporter
MPLPMRQLGLVQFFSWFALFLMWVFTTPAIAEHIYAVQAGDTTSLGYADAGNWVGILFGIYNAVSAIYALCLPKVANRLGRKGAHGFSLLIGGLSLLSIYFIGNPNGLILPMIGIGIAWGSILAMPYAILSDSIPSHKMGLYMGLFNFFITFPQIVSGLTGGFLIKYVFQGQAIYGLVLSGVLMLFAAWSVVRIKE